MKCIGDNIFVRVKQHEDTSGIILPDTINDRPQNWPTSGTVVSAGNKSVFAEGDTVYFCYAAMQDDPNAKEIFLRDSDITFYLREGVFYCAKGYVLCKPLSNSESNLITEADFELEQDTKNLEVYVEGNMVRKRNPHILKRKIKTYNKALVLVSSTTEDGEDLLPGERILFQKHGWQPVQPEFKQTLFDGMELIIIKTNSIDGKEHSKDK